MVCPISQAATVSLRRPSDSENVLGGVFSVVAGLRYYNPELGRWINRDPIEEKGGANIYGFIAHNSHNTVDLIGNGVADQLVEEFGNIFGNWISDAFGNLVVVQPPTQFIEIGRF